MKLLLIAITYREPEAAWPGPRFDSQRTTLDFLLHSVCLYFHTHVPSMEPAATLTHKGSVLVQIQEFTIIYRKRKEMPS